MEKNKVLSILRILNTAGATIGTGFLVSPTLALTCLHVELNASPDAENHIRVRFEGTIETILATVLNEFFDDDLTLLRLDKTPETVHPLSLGLAVHSQLGNALYTFGYAIAANEQGIHGNGTFNGLSGKQVQFRMHEADHGHSGAPLYDVKRQVVIGIIQKGKDQLGRNSETTFAIASERVFELCPEILPAEESPYPGLRSFSAETRHLFFGREKLTRELVKTIQQGTHFLAVFGPSGSGKSSVVRAGLLPALANGILSGWQQVTLRPAENPFEQLKIAGVDSPLNLLHQTLLFIDQFEELFTLCPDHPREQFVRELTAALAKPGFMLVITMRDDFYSAFHAKAAPLAAAEKTLVNVPGMLDEDDLRAMIERPAQETSLHLQEGLTETMLKDLRRDDGTVDSASLPLLAFALEQLWQQRVDGALTHVAYDGMGGVAGSLARRADEAYRSLPKSDQPYTENLFLSLVHLGNEQLGIPDTRKYGKLDALTSKEREMVTHFVNLRLLSTNDEVVEMIHDALLPQWQRLQNWLRDDHDNRRLQQDVREAAQRWQDGKRDEGLLNPRDKRLDQAQTLSQNPRYGLGRIEQTYLQACIALRDKESRERETLRRRIVSGLTAGLFVALVLAGFAIFFWNNANLARQDAQNQAATAQTASTDAVKQRKDAETAKADADTKAQIARIGELSALSIQLRDQQAIISYLIGLEVFKALDNSRTRATLLDNLELRPQATHYMSRHTNRVNSVVFSPDGKMLASGSDDNTIILWDVATGQPIGMPLKGHTRSVESVAFSPDGKTLASGSLDNTIILWNVSTGWPIGQPLKGHISFVESVAFSPDGKTLASGSWDHTIILWDVATGQPTYKPLKGHTDFVESVAFSPDGKTLASGSWDHTIILWDVATGQLIGQPLKGHTSFVDSVAFSPNGKTLASGSWDHTIILWDVATGQPIGMPLKGDTYSVSNVVFSPDGKTLVSGNNDNMITFWDISTLSNTNTLTTSQHIGQLLKGHTDTINSVAFSPDGKTFASGSDDSTIILWNTSTLFNTSVSIWQPIGQQLKKHTDAVDSVAFSPNGKTLASGSWDHTIILWDVATSQPIGQTLKRHTASVSNVVFSPDGKTLASGSWDNTIILWDVVSGQPIGAPLQRHIGRVRSVAFSPDNKMLASGSDDNTIILWNIAAGQPIYKPLKGHTDFVESVAFSPDGKTLASGSDDNTIILWNIATGQPISQPLKGHTSSVKSVAFSPDGKTLVSGSGDNTIILWDVATGQLIGQPLRGHTSSVESVVFSPNGKTLASGSWDNTIILWDIEPQSWVEKTCQLVGRNFTRAEWTQYFPDEPYRATCPNLPLEPESTATSTP